MCSFVCHGPGVHPLSPLHVTLHPGSPVLIDQLARLVEPSVWYGFLSMPAPLSRWHTDAASRGHRTRDTPVVWPCKKSSVLSRLALSELLALCGLTCVFLAVGKSSSALVVVVVVGLVILNCLLCAHRASHHAQTKLSFVSNKFLIMASLHALYRLLHYSSLRSMFHFGLGDIFLPSTIKHCLGESCTCTSRMLSLALGACC